MVRINVREGKVVGRKLLSTRNLELGVINPKFLGRKNRYAFMAEADLNGKCSTIVKLDFDLAGGNDCVVAARSFGERCFAGEPFFVGKEEGNGEDDGYVLTYTHDEGSWESSLVVMDAKSPTLDIVATVQLPQRVPYSYHGLFVTITFPTITNIRLGWGPDQIQLRTHSPKTSTTTTGLTRATPSPPPHSTEPINVKREGSPPPPLEKAARAVTQPYKLIASPLPLHVMLCNALDDFISNFVNRHPLPSSINPKDVLAGNYAPVGELPPTKCTGEGRLPRCLDGAYIRNGLNPQFAPNAAYHLFDGDGMLHAMQILGGQATFCSRFVRTYKFTKEEEAGMPIYPNLFALNGAARWARGIVFAVRVLTGQINPTNGLGLANTGLSFLDNTLMALAESDLPYVVQLMPDGDVITVGRWDFARKLSMGMTAHPKVDPVTGEVFALRYGRIPPFLNYFIIGVDGTKQPDVPIFSFRQPSFVLAITERYAIFPDMQMVMKPLAMFTRMGPPMGCEARKVTRVGIIPRYATDESKMKWIEVPGFNFVHSVNAWDEKGGQEVVLVATKVVPVEHMLERMSPPLLLGDGEDQPAGREGGGENGTL
ncbi:putative carotenoid cleavage dioxygenase 4 [Nymphaea thermarum]|nr:putative carotenoid cleavage dioxygenase 4 [Nymphaea thermarum]